MRGQVVEVDLQPLSAGGYTERTVVGAFEDSRLSERGLQRGRWVAVGALGVVSKVVSGRPGWSLVVDQT